MNNEAYLVPNPATPCQPRSAVWRRSPPLDFTGYRKSASTSPILSGMSECRPFIDEHSASS